MRNVSRIPTAPGKKPKAFHPQATPPPQPQQVLQGTVYKKSLGHYEVHVGDHVVACTLSSKLRKHLVYPVADRTSVRPIVMEVRDIQAQDPIAIGDVVYVAPGGPDTGMITDVMPRTRKLSRRAAGPKPLEQVIVANADQLVAVVAGAFPDPSWELLDRYLAAAEEAELPALIVITKADLLEDSAVGGELEAYRRIGYRVLLTSATGGLGVEGCRAELRGRLSVFAGKSGVGKTTLLNTVQPGLGLRVNEVSGVTGKGKHTTTHLQMFPLEMGGSIVDTPGMREFGLWNVAGAEIATLFPEMRPLVGQCRFGLDCTHAHEPDCAIRDAVAAGSITQRRYHSYLRMAR